jgi:hypothetical protein
MPFTQAAYSPMALINIDTIGPLPVDQHDYCHILVIIDCFTRWVELFPLKSTEAKETAIALHQHVGRYGLPHSIQSDRGKQFVNALISELFTAIGTKQKLTTAYSKQENAIVERANKEVLRHLNAILFDKRIRHNWSREDLPMVQRIMNTEVHSSTGVSPAQLLFGDAIHLERGILETFDPEIRNRDKDISLSDYMSNMLERQAELIRVAQEHQAEKDGQHLDSKGKGPFTEFPVSSYVLLSRPDRPPDKFTPVWEGPFQVVAHKGSKYTIQHLLTAKETDVHISRLKPFLVDPTIDPKSVVMHAEQEFMVEEILDHRGDPKRRTEMEFLVKWAGYDDSENSWEPWKNLRVTEQLHAYLKQKGWKQLLPSHLR